MAGSLTQLGAIGKEDVNTTIGPQLTFWKSGIKKHTAFALEPKTVEFTGTCDWQRPAICTLPRNGDLITKMYLQLTLGKLDNGNGGARYVDDVGRYMLEKATLEVGSVIFDQLYSELEHVQHELTTPKEKAVNVFTGKSSNEQELIDWAKSDQVLLIPLCFYFCNDYGASLPIISLHLTDVKINLKLRSKESCVVSTSNIPYVPKSTDALITDMHVVTELVFLDDAERDWFAQKQHKYVITQTQFLGNTTIPRGVKESKIDLTFNHPTKELLIMFRTESNTNAKNYFNFTGLETEGRLAGEAFKSMILKLNANDRFEKQDPHYFRLGQTQWHHTRIPEKPVYVYSFALYPEDPNPSGSLNLSRIDTARLVFEYSNATPEPMELFVFARSLNVTTIGSGVMLLAYAT